MATDKYPQQNHNIPMSDEAVDAVRQARLNPGGGVAPVQAPANGKGSRREVRPGEWVDDRVIEFGSMTASPSEGTPPALRGMDGKALPTFTAGKTYDVVLGKSCVFAGRVLSPSMKFQMTGETCLDPAVTPCIVEATELGDTPTAPDVAPSGAKKKA